MIAISIKVPASYFIDSNKMIMKITWNSKQLGITKNIKK